MAPQSLLLPLRCPACGRPGRELSSCPWCGESGPLAPRTRGDLVRVAAGLALLAAGTLGTLGTAGTAGMAGTLETAGTAGTAGILGATTGFFLVCSSPPSERGVARSAGGSTPCGADPAATPASAGMLRTAAAALLAALLGLALRAFGAPFPLPGAARLAWLLPALAAAAFALRVPAEAPDAPASGATARARAWRRHAPDLVAAALLLPFALAFAAGAPAGPSIAGLSLVLGALLGRLSSPTAPLLLSAAAFALLLPDPAFLAFGMLARTLWSGLWHHGCGRRGGVSPPPRRAGPPD